MASKKERSRHYDRILSRTRINTVSGCWEWCGPRNPGGYGQYYGIKKYGFLVHRLSWTFHNGKSPGKKHVLHKCDVRNCINPEHLFLGTHRDNVADMIKKGRNIRGSGHPLSSLTERDVRLIFSDPRPHRKIAVEYGVSHSVITGIMYGITWKHVTGGVRAPARKIGRPMRLKCSKGHAFSKVDTYYLRTDKMCKKCARIPSCAKSAST